MLLTTLTVVFLILYSSIFSHTFIIRNLEPKMLIKHLQHVGLTSPKPGDAQDNASHSVPFVKLF